MNWPLRRALPYTSAVGRRVNRGSRGRKPRDAATLCPGGGQPSAAGRGVVPVRRARPRAEVRHAVARRHGAGAARSELPLVRQHARSPAPRSSAAMSSRSSSASAPRCCSRGRARSRCSSMPLLVSLNMIPKVALGPLIIVWFKLRHRAQHDDGVRDLLLPDRADHRARPARGRARPARPGALAEGLALADLHQDPAAQRAALHLLRHEGGGDPRGRRRHRRRVPRLRPRPRLPDAAGAGDARHRRDVHGGDPDHAASAWCSTAWCSASSACSSCATRASSRRTWANRSSISPA